MQIQTLCSETAASANKAPVCGEGKLRSPGRCTVRSAFSFASPILAFIMSFHVERA